MLEQIIFFVVHGNIEKINHLMKVHEIVIIF